MERSSRSELLLARSWCFWDQASSGASGSADIADTDWFSNSAEIHVLEIEETSFSAVFQRRSSFLTPRD